MRRILCNLVLAVGLMASTGAWAQVLAPAAPEDVGLSSERLERIETALSKEIADGKLPGAVVMVARHGRLAYAKSFGLRDPVAASPMTNDAIFRIYSMTKVLVSVAAMTLVEEGRVQLTDPVSKFLPAFGNLQVSTPKTDAFDRVNYIMIPAEREMTIQDLLRHTAGLAYGELTENEPVLEAYVAAGAFKPDGLPFDARHVTPAEQVAALAQAPLIHQPGTRWVYSVASDILGRVIESVSGMRLDDFLDQRLFAPLGMEDTGFFVPAEDMERVAQPFEGTTLIDVSEQPANDSGGAGGVSTVADYLRFCQMLLNGGRLGDTRILSRTTVRLMTSDHLGSRIIVPIDPSELLLGTPGYTFGLGLAVRRGMGIAGVSGSAGEFTWGGYAGTYFWIDPSESLVGVMMTQMPGPTRAYYRRMIRELVYQAIAD